MFTSSGFCVSHAASHHGGAAMCAENQSSIKRPIQSKHPAQPKCLVQSFRHAIDAPGTEFLQDAVAIFRIGYATGTQPIRKVTRSLENMTSSIPTQTYPTSQNKARAYGIAEASRKPQHPAYQRDMTRTKLSKTGIAGNDHTQ